MANQILRPNLLFQTPIVSLPVTLGDTAHSHHLGEHISTVSVFLNSKNVMITDRHKSTIMEEVVGRTGTGASSRF